MVSKTTEWSLFIFKANYSVSVIQFYASTTNAKEAEQFYDELQDLLELTPKKDVLFIIGDWDANVGIWELPGVTGKFGVGVQNEAGQRLMQFYQENALLIENNVIATMGDTGEG